MSKQEKRNRPQLSTTIAGDTQAVLSQVAKEVALPNPGVTIDYIVNDWLSLKRAAIQAAAPRPTADPTAVSA